MYDELNKKELRFYKERLIKYIERLRMQYDIQFTNIYIVSVMNEIKMLDVSFSDIERIEKDFESLRFTFDQRFTNTYGSYESFQSMDKNSLDDIYMMYSRIVPMVLTHEQIYWMFHINRENFVSDWLFEFICEEYNKENKNNCCNNSRKVLVAPAQNFVPYLERLRFAFGNVDYLINDYENCNLLTAPMNKKNIILGDDIDEFDKNREYNLIFYIPDNCTSKVRSHIMESQLMLFIEQLVDEGRLIVILRKKDREIVDKCAGNNVSKIINLPVGALEKQRQEYILIEIVKASSFIIKTENYYIKDNDKVRIEKIYNAYTHQDKNVDLLSNLARVFRGKGNSTAVEDNRVQKEDVRYITLKNLSGEGIKYKETDTIKLSRSEIEKYVLRENDILVSIKGTSFKIDVFKEQDAYAENVVNYIPSESIVVIRAFEEIMALYLSVYFKNYKTRQLVMEQWDISEKAQINLSAKKVGNTLIIVNKKDAVVNEYREYIKISEQLKEIATKIYKLLP